MPRAKRGEIWMADLGLAAKVRPVLVLSVAYEGQERAIGSYVIRTTSLRFASWMSSTVQPRGVRNPRPPDALAFCPRYSA